jgi:hypothetical protein
VSGLDRRSQAAASDASTRQYERIAELEGRGRKVQRELDELAHPFSEGLKAILDSEVAPVTNREKSMDGHLRVFAEWLDRLVAFSNEERDNEVSRLRREIAGLAIERQPEARQAVEAGRFAEALRLIRGLEDRTVQFEGHAPPLRETVWRDAAAAEYPDPRRRLPELAGDSRNGFVTAWRQGLEGNLQKDRKVRTEFQKAFLPDALSARNTASDVRVPCQNIRKWISSQGLNPCFLPQLAGHADLVIATATRKPNHSDFIDQVVGSREKKPTDLYVYLAPAVTAAVREKALREIRNRKVNVSIIDDLDLCRLADQQGPSGRLVGLMELVLGQQQLLSASPFTTHDGAQVRMEMYVGRRQEAETLALAQDYSRVFSGRRLGKSALLRFVQEHYNGLQLPSGCTLRVLFIQSVGAETETDVVDRILEQMKEQLSFGSDGSGIAVEPGPSLVKALKQFLAERPDESLLIILDEADTFVEAQIEAYARDKEKCLSFLMRSGLASAVDSQGLLRVRFVFSGYRATNTVEGAWANWGQILRLVPLTPEDASQLIAGPLARLGIDASDQAHTIAYRCGYQPAVLLKFGERLVRHFATRAPNAREPMLLTPEDVASVANEAEVHNEIRTIVQNNFQGNPGAHVVFRALLDELADVPPGQGIEDAAERVLVRLVAINPDSRWLHHDPNLALTEIHRMLRDFVDRQLIVERRDGKRGLTVPRHALRFPHHLPVIRQNDQTETIRSEIKGLLKEVGQRSTSASTVRSLLPLAVNQNLQFCISRPYDPDLAIRAAVIGTLWPEAAADRSGGIPDRIGIEHDGVVTASEASVERTHKARLAVVDTSPADVEAVLVLRDSSLPLPLFIGGVDLLRWAVEQNLSEQQGFEVASLGRMAPEALDWWFQRVRGYVFDSPGSISTIHKMTAGIPWLVRWVDESLRMSGRQDFSRKDLQEGCHGAELRIAENAKLLRGGSPSVRLTGREIEILKMAAHAARKCAPSMADLREDLRGENWDELHRDEECPFEALSPTDDVAVSVLERLGLLPVEPGRPERDPIGRLGRLDRDDAVVRLAELIG